ncbi:hypothetical protein AB3N59_05140 [Leptospira sp. WS92.C1]
MNLFEIPIIQFIQLSSFFRSKRILLQNIFLAKINKSVVSAKLYSKENLQNVETNTFNFENHSERRRNPQGHPGNPSKPEFVLKRAGSNPAFFKSLL